MTKKKLLKFEIGKIIKNFISYYRIIISFEHYHNILHNI